MILTCLHTGPKHVVLYYISLLIVMGTAVAQWLRCCATNLKVAGSIADDVNGIFEVDSASNRNEYQEYFLGVKAAGA